MSKKQTTKMNYLRAIASGTIVWTGVVISFFVLENIPLLNLSMDIQAILVGLLIVIYAWIAAQFYYKNGNKTRGLPVGIIMSLTALALDLVITIPFVEIPKGSSYQIFLSNPFLWILTVINVITVHLYWKRKVMK